MEALGDSAQARSLYERALHFARGKDERDDEEIKKIEESLRSLTGGESPSSS